MQVKTKTRMRKMTRRWTAPEVTEQSTFVSCSTSSHYSRENQLYATGMWLCGSLDWIRMGIICSATCTLARQAIHNPGSACVTRLRISR